MRALKCMLRGRGAALVGFADLRQLPGAMRLEMPFAVSMAVALNPQIVAQIRSGPTEAYYGEYRRANVLLDELAAAGADFLKQRGHRAAALAATSFYDPANYCSPLPHKTAATRAGLGWIGKCALLITERFGAAVRLNTVLTDAELHAGEPVDASRCEDCTACVEICPGGAPTGRHWQPGLARQELFNAFACASGARRAAAKAGIKETICGMCVAACPWTRRYLEGHAK